MARGPSIADARAQYVLCCFVPLALVCAGRHATRVAFNVNIIAAAFRLVLRGRGMVGGVWGEREAARMPLNLESAFGV